MSIPSSKTAVKRLLVIEPHPITRAGLIQLFEHERDMKVIADVDCFEEALAILRRSPADLVLLGTTLLDRGCIEFIKDVHSSRAELAILVFSLSDESFYAERALRAGARGYIAKREPGCAILAAARTVLGGSIYASEDVAAGILEKFSGRRRGGGPRSELTEREFEFFQLLGEGLSTKQIADLMKISVKTVEAHRVHIKSKLGLTTASALLAFAARWNATENEGENPPLVSGISVSRMSRTRKKGRESSR